MFTVIDFETTGLSPDDSVVIEIGAIKLTHTLLIKKTFTTKVALPEGVEVPEFITNLTGLKTEDLKDAPVESIAFDELEDFIGNDYVVAHNAPFDLSFLYKYLPEASYDFVDTRAIIKLIEPEESAKLKDAVERYNIDYKDHHTALADCHMTVELLKHLRKKLYKEKSQGLLHYANVAVDSEERPLTYVPKRAKVVTLNK